MSEETERRFREMMDRLGIGREGGQGESPGPSFLVRPVIDNEQGRQFAQEVGAVLAMPEIQHIQEPLGEPEYPQLRPPSMNEAWSSITGESWDRAYQRWREEMGRPVTVPFQSDSTQGMSFRLGGGTNYQAPRTATEAQMRYEAGIRGRQLSPDGLFEWQDGRGYVPMGQQIGGIMKVSVKGPELTVREKAQLKEGYKSILQRGYGSLGVDRKLTLWIDDVPHTVRTDNGYWTISGRDLYVGARENRADGAQLATVSARLAVTSALMGLTGHASDAELLVEFEKALAKMLAGQFEEAVKPLGVAGDDRPVGKMAWSATGVAAWVDGAWCSPVTGEPVSVGEGWTVIETGEGPVEVTPTSSGSVPAPQQVVQAGSVAERFQAWLRANTSNNQMTLEDGRQAFVWYGASERERDYGVEELRRRFEGELGELEFGVVSDEHVGGGWWMVPRGVPVAQTASEPARSRSQEDWERQFDGTSWGTARLEDGRLGINSVNENYFTSLRDTTFRAFDLEFVRPHPESEGWDGLTVVRRSEPVPF